MKGILIEGADYIITMDPGRTIITDGALAIVNGRIAAVGKSKDLKKRYPLDQTISARRKIVMPGLVNCHMHTTQQLARGLADWVSQPGWIHERIYPYEAQLTPDDAYISASLACLEMIKSGTTTFADPGGYNMEKVVEASIQSGLRAVLARSAMDVSTASRPLPDALKESVDSILAKSEDFLTTNRDKGEGRINPVLSLRIVRVCSDQLCRGMAKLAKKYKCLIQVHAAATKPSVEGTQALFGMTDIVRLNTLGVLGPNVLATHMNWLTEEEIGMVKTTDTKVCHCPTTSPNAGAYGSFAVGKFPEMIAAGIVVALGCDAAPCSHFLDLFRVAYQTVYYRDVRLNPFIMSAETVLEMATTQGARALGMEAEIGSLETGKKADVILLNMNECEFVPCHNPVSNIVHAACGHTVDTVIVDGHVLMSERSVINMDEHLVLAEGQKAARRVAKRAGLDAIALPKWPIV